MRRPKRTGLRSERGSALVVSVLVLMVVTLLAVAAVGISVQTSRSTRRDANDKSALEAANAGLQIATYRLSTMEPSGSQCVGDTVASPGANGTCASSTTTLGNGSSYQYFMTPALGSGSTCVGSTLQSSSPAISQRCITAVGTTNGVSERAQVRVAEYAATPLFQYGGLTGLKGIGLNGNVNVSGDVASNGTISINGNSSVGNVWLGPSGTFTHSGNVSYKGKTVLTSPIVLDPVEPGTSATTNDDYRITNGLSKPPTSPYDQSNSVSFKASTRTLTMSGNSSLTLGGSIYNFCEMNISGNAQISIAPGAKVEIIIDSPDDPGSGCPSGTGSMIASGNVSWTNPTQDPTALQIYAYGLNDGSGVVDLNGNAGFWGVIYAPQSTVTANGNAGFTGAIAGASVNFNGNAFNWDSRAGSLMATTNGVYYRTAWAQCTPELNLASPGSSCG